LRVLVLTTQAPRSSSSGGLNPLCLHNGGGAS
jgi:hypothetical protein